MSHRKQRYQVEQELHGLVDELEKKGVSRLPSLRVLAESIGAAKQTLQQALHTLAAEERIVIVPRQGAFIKAAHSVPRVAESLITSANPQDPCKWMRLKRLIERDILSGMVRPANEEYFTIAELTRHYMASYFTMRKAMGALVDEGVLIEGAGGYRRSPQQQLAYSLIVVEFLPLHAIETPFTTNLDPLQGFSLALERQSNLVNLNLYVSTWYYDSSTGQPVFPDLDANLFDTPEFKGRILGFVIHGRMLHPTGLEHLSARLSPHRKPIAVLVNSDPLAGESQPADRRPNVHWFSFTYNPLHGRIMGQYLASMGHRKIAYVSLHHQSLWSQFRYQGLCSAFSPWGGRSCVAPYCTEEQRPIQTNLRTQREQMLKKYFYRDVPGATKEIKQLDKPVAFDVSMLEEQVLAAGQEVFRACLEDRSLSAWVVANDVTAAGVVAYLRRKNVRIPQDLVVTSFDNTFWSLTSEITSYDYNYEQISRAILSFFFDYPSSARKKTRIAARHVRGVVIQRRSSRKRIPLL